MARHFFVSWFHVKQPKHIVSKSRYKYKLKGVGPIDYHLGGNFRGDIDDMLHYRLHKYIDKLIVSFVPIFGHQLVECTSALIKGDHLEHDNSPKLEKEDIKQYQSMIGTLQWMVTLHRFDIMAAMIAIWAE